MFCLILVKSVIVAEIISDMFKKMLHYLGVTNSGVTRFIASGKKPDVDGIIRNL
jgi:hypothetical protein